MAHHGFLETFFVVYKNIYSYLFVHNFDIHLEFLPRPGVSRILFFSVYHISPSGNVSLKDPMLQSCKPQVCTWIPRSE